MSFELFNIITAYGDQVNLTVEEDPDSILNNLKQFDNNWSKYNPRKDIKAEIRKGDEVLADIGGIDADWKTFFEPFGQSTYWDGGEYKARVEAGLYKIFISSTKNDSKYSLAIGEIEAFDGKEGLNALNLIPDLKRDFFEESPVSFIKSPFGWGYILIMYVLAFAAGFLYRLILNTCAVS